MPDKSYKIGDDVFDIPTDQIEGFEKDNPSAVEVESFTLGTDTFDIPVTEVQGFIDQNPKARRFKKKDFTGPGDGEIPSTTKKPVQAPPTRPYARTDQPEEAVKILPETIKPPTGELAATVAPSGPIPPYRGDYEDRTQQRKAEEVKKFEETYKNYRDKAADYMRDHAVKAQEEGYANDKEYRDSLKKDQAKKFIDDIDIFSIITTTSLVNKWKADKASGDLSPEVADQFIEMEEAKIQVLYNKVYTGINQDIEDLQQRLREGTATGGGLVSPETHPRLLNEDERKALVVKIDNLKELKKGVFPANRQESVDRVFEEERDNIVETVRSIRDVLPEDVSKAELLDIYFNVLSSAYDDAGKKLGIEERGQLEQALRDLGSAAIPLLDNVLVSDEEREYYMLGQKLRTLAPIVMMNAHPLALEKEGAGELGVKTLLQTLFPSEVERSATQKQQAETIQDVFSELGVRPSDSYDKLIEARTEHDFWEGTVELGAGLLGITPKLMVSGGIVGGASRLLGLARYQQALSTSNKFTDRATAFMIRAGEEEVKFALAFPEPTPGAGVGFKAGVEGMGQISQMFSSKYGKIIAPWLQKVLGASIGTTAGMEASETASALVDVMTTDKDFNDAMVQMGYKDEEGNWTLSEKGQHTLQKLIVNGVLGFTAIDNKKEFKGSLRELSKEAENLGLSKDAKEFLDIAEKLDEVIKANVKTMDVAKEIAQKEGIEVQPAEAPKPKEPVAEVKPEPPKPTEDVTDLRKKEWEELVEKDDIEGINALRDQVRKDIEDGKEVSDDFLKQLELPAKEEILKDVKPEEAPVEEMGIETQAKVADELKALEESKEPLFWEGGAEVTKEGVKDQLTVFEELSTEKKELYADEAYIEHAHHEAAKKWKAAQEPVEAPVAEKPVEAPKPEEPVVEAPPEPPKPVEGKEEPPAEPEAPKPTGEEVIIDEKPNNVNVGSEIVNPEFKAEDKVKIEGKKAKISMPDGEKREATFQVVEAEDIIASHNESSFNESKGYPTREGKNINDRNYKGDKGAQADVIKNAAKLDEDIVISNNATPEGGVPIITSDGIVVSGNGRTMSIKLAASQHPERYKAYTDKLTEEVDTYGIDAEKLAGMKQPILVKVDANFTEYSTKELAKYNAPTMKAEASIDRAVKIGRTLAHKDNERFMVNIMNEVAKHEKFSDLYASREGQKAIKDNLLKSGVIQEREISRFFDEQGNLTKDGKDLLETSLIGTIISENALRAGEIEGVKGFRNKILTALPALAKNKALGEYSLSESISDAVILQQEFNKSGIKEFDAYLRTPKLFGEMQNIEAAYIHQLIQAGGRKFKTTIEKYNQSAESNFGNDMSMFETLSKDQIFEKLTTLDLDEATRQSISKAYDLTEQQRKGGPAEVSEPGAKPEPAKPAEPRIAEELRKAAETVRKAKINKPGQFKASIGFDVIWDSGLEVIATSLEAGADITVALSKGLKHIQESDWYKNLKPNKQKEFDAVFEERMQEHIPKEKRKPEDVEPTVDGEIPVVDPAPAVEGKKPVKSKAEAVEELYDQQRKDYEEKRKTTWEKIRNKATTLIFDVSGNVKRRLLKEGGEEVVAEKDLIAGASAESKMDYEDASKKIFKKLSMRQEWTLAGMIQSKRTIELDKLRDEAGEPRVKHPKGYGEDYHKEYLENLKENNPEGFKEIEARAEEYFKTMRAQLDKLHKAELLTDEAYEQLKEAQYYSPREFIQHLDPEVQHSIEGKTISVPDSGIKSLKEGSEESLIHDPRKLLNQVISRTNARIAKNKANVALHKFAEKNPDNGFVTVQEPIGKTESGALKYPSTPAGKTLISAQIKGETVRMLMDNEFASEWIRKDPLLNADAANVMSVASGASTLRFMATGANPAFALTNVPRDVAHVLLLTDVYSPILPLGLAQISKDIATVSKDAVTRTGRYRDYIKEGGGMEFLTQQGRILRGENIPVSKVKRATDTITHVLGYFNEASEVMVRLAIRERSIANQLKEFKTKFDREPTEAEQNAIQRKATWEARNQMDFSQGGSAAKAFDALIPYTNASIQGTRVLIRYATSEPKTFAKKVAQLGGVAIGLYLYNSDQPGWDDVSDVIKSMNFIIMTPYYTTNKEGQKEYRYITIPKSHEQIAIAGMFEGLAEYTHTGKLPTKKSVRDLKLSLPGIPFITNQPPIVDAIRTYESNWDNFREEEIWKGNKVENWAEYTKYTPEFWKDAGKLLDMSPEKMKRASEKVTTNLQNNFYTNLGGMAWDLVTDGLSNEQKDDVNNTITKQMEEALHPLMRRYLKSTNPRDGGEDLERYTIEENTRRKLQNDVVRDNVDKYVKGDITPRQFNDQVLSEYDPMERERMMKLFLSGKRNKGVDFWYTELKFAPSASVKARTYFDKWKGASEEERKEMHKTAAKMGGIFSDKFWLTFNTLQKPYVNK